MVLKTFELVDLKVIFFQITHSNKMEGIVAVALCDLFEITCNDGVCV